MKRFVITRLADNGLRTLVGANQGRNFYSTRGAADAALVALRPDLESKLSFRALEVREIECYENGDAKGIYSEMNLCPVTGRPFMVTCIACGKTALGGDGAAKFFADTEGVPFKSYYCEECAAPALELQEAIRKHG